MHYSFQLDMNPEEPLVRIIRGDVFVPHLSLGDAPQSGVLIICHGFKGFKDWGFFPHTAAQLAEKTGLMTVCFNFSHNGIGSDLLTFSEPEKFAINTYTYEQEDLTALLALIRSDEFNNSLEHAKANSTASGVRSTSSFTVHTAQSSARSNTSNLESDHINIEQEANFSTNQNSQALKVPSAIRTDNSLEDAPIFVLGHSRGGATAILYALDHPTELTGVISWNGVTNMDLYSEAQKEELRRTGRSQVINARTGEALPLDAVVLHDLELNRARYDLIGRISSASFPLLLVQGSDDLPGFRDGSARIVEHYAQASWHTVQDAGHTFNAVHPFAGATDALDDAIQTTATWIREQLQA
ncbi:alpha/beta hydrolase [Paenibacillus sp. ACRRX]|uniref:alpha/beta fold hydrolase n=1 Tax=Paenibacillus sp. ACRRX TaxID=2918206 RepID=UPI001EF437A9|nr:alpha/beta hydrolase [Paenibacillus sp. ACRRX]MCG7408547.1 alpha/beta hydrolase [Paenibacillus sp. ACRRX]